MSLPKICHTYPAIMSFGSYTLPKEDPKSIWITWHTLWVLLTSEHNVMIYVHDVTNQILLLVSNYIADVIVWPKFRNSSIYMREVIINSILWEFDQKSHFFQKCSRLKFSNLELALGIVLKFYTSVAKGLKLKFRKFWGLNPTFVEVTGGKLVGRVFMTPPILNRVNIQAALECRWFSLKRVRDTIITCSYS